MRDPYRYSSFSRWCITAWRSPSGRGVVGWTLATPVRHPLAPPGGSTRCVSRCVPPDGQIVMFALCPLALAPLALCALCASDLRRYDRPRSSPRRFPAPPRLAVATPPRGSSPFPGACPPGLRGCRPAPGHLPFPAVCPIPWPSPRDIHLALSPGAPRCERIAWCLAAAVTSCLSPPTRDSVRRSSGAPQPRGWGSRGTCSRTPGSHASRIGERGFAGFAGFASRRFPDASRGGMDIPPIRTSAGRHGRTRHAHRIGDAPVSLIAGGGLAGSGRYHVGFGARHHAAMCPGYRRERSGAATRPRAICPWESRKRGMGSHGERPHPVGDRSPPGRGGHAPPLEPATAGSGRVGPGRAGRAGRAGHGIRGLAARGARAIPRSVPSVASRGPIAGTAVWRERLGFRGWRGGGGAHLRVRVPVSAWERAWGSVARESRRIPQPGGDAPPGRRRANREGRAGGRAGEGRAGEGRAGEGRAGEGRA